MRRPLLATTSVLLLTALGACSGGAAPSTAPPATSSAASSAAAAKLTSATEFVTAVNAAMLAKKTVHLSTAASDSRKPGEAATTKTQLRFEEGGKVSSLMVAEGGADKTTVLQLPTESFLKDADNEKETPGKPWRQVKTGGDDLFSKVMTPLVVRMTEASDPSRGIAHFGTAGQLDAPVPEQVDGVAATRYTITVDYAKVVAATTDKLVKGNFESKIKLNRSALKHEIWLDAGNLPLRWRSTESGKVEFTTTVDAKFQDWGKPVEIAAPPAAQIGQPS
ncbi:MULTISPECIES: hypothetical protein [unclassified Crossiella]|uniref:hypothetical protein n=1 Tax=unclassified Crossiella TaxID=2620835 RepID=UPI001FFF89DE|nr:MULTISPECIES: hypothetical protein [unclassified Crossiella]MCK2243909.1 hypothetical protein [Crossiella sp. S99.2]MCK2257233.1 hypothetical protein [Crossiella sp. S99.1]